MLGSIPIALIVGTAVGFLAGLGVGGGSLLMIWMTLVLGLDQDVARNINLLFFIPTAIIASVFRWKQGTVNIRKIIPAILSGCISAGIFAWVRPMLQASLLKTAFGVLLVATGVHELFYRPRKAK